MCLINATTHDAFSCRKGNTVINSETFIKVFQSIGSDFFSSFTENADDISNVVFALGIVGVDILQSFKETSIIKYIGSCIDFLDLFFKISRILLLHDTKHFSILITNNTPITKRIFSFCSKDCSNVLVIYVEINQVLKTFTSNEWCVTSNNQCLSRKSFKNWLSHHNRMTSS